MEDRLQTLFLAALDLPPDQRGPYLDRACADTPDLRAAVESLLAADARATSDGFLERPAVARPLDTPTHLGPYRLGRCLGEGGMGQVYLAYRDDGAYEQQVAIKLMRTGLQSSELVARFRAERQILATLQHPHIATLHDGGVAPDGRPYLVMEYVDGLPITDYCDLHRLSVPRRLRLFQKVCLAVQSAHQRLIVHRDLKPANILVGTDGEPRLLDFGIAKALDPAMGPATETRAETRLLTPAYAAPEQIRGEPITTATDVYALGVVLYELLAGVRPFDLEGRSRYDLERLICEVDPPRPGHAAIPESAAQTRQATPAALRRQLRGDLDAIVLRALRKEPERRYESAAALSADLHRHLRHWPVAARSDSRGYHVHKFARRHRAILGFAAIIAGLLIALATREVNLRRTAESARNEALQEAARATAIADFMVELFDVADPFSQQAVRADTLTVRDFLVARGARVRELADVPEVQQRALNTVGHMYFSLGLYDESRALLEDALLVGATRDGGRHLEGIQTLRELGELDAIQGRYARSLARYQTALAHYDALDLDDPALESHLLNGIGETMRRMGDPAGAEANHRRALELRIDAFGADALLVAHSQNNLGLTLWEQDRLAEAESLLTRSISSYREALGDTNMNVSAGLNNLGLVAFARGAQTKGIQFMEESLRIKEELLGPDHWRTANGIMNLGWMAFRAGRVAEGEAGLRQALSILRRALGDTHDQVGVALQRLGQVCAASGRLDEAESYFRQALAIKEDAVLESDPERASTAHHLGQLLLDTGRPEEALPLLETAYAARATRYGEADTRTQASRAARDAAQVAQQRKR